jgi:hypothetical protein
MITSEMLDNWFTYHSPEGTVKNHPNVTKQEAYLQIREGGKYFAQIIVDCTPPSADQTAAIRLIRQAVMTANQSIACEGS